MDMAAYEVLTDDETISDLKKRREEIGIAIENLLGEMEQDQVQRRELDNTEQKRYSLVKRLDAAYARITRGKKYSDKAKLKLIRRAWTDETYQWLERFLGEWARKQLLDGPKSVDSLYTSNAMGLSLVDVIALMRDNPDMFDEQKGPKPKRKFARSSNQWSLVHNSSRYSHPPFPLYWNVEAALLDADQPRNRTLSEKMHAMMEEAIRLFYAKQYTSVIHAFNDLFWKDFARSFMYYRSRVETLEGTLEALKGSLPTNSVPSETSVPSA